MRPFPFSIEPQPGQRISPIEMAILDALQSISDNSQLDNATQILRDFSVDNYTKTTTLDAATASTADIANFVCTLADAIKKGGLKAER